MTEKMLKEKGENYYIHALDEFIVFEILKDNNSKERVSDDLEMLIFTSGSTSDPKAVPLTKKKISTMIESMNRRWDLKPDDKFLTWLPITHVTELILMRLMPLYTNLTQMIIDPELVVSQPEKWLQLVQENDITHTCTTNTGMHSVLNYYLENSNLIPTITKCKAISTMGELVTPFYGMSEGGYTGYLK